MDDRYQARVTGDLDVRWIHGSPSAKHNRDPEIQVHHYDERTVILRQNMSVHYEAPFLYLLLGDDQAVLVDSGATPQHGFFPLRATVDRLLAGWLAEHPRDHYELLVAHSHSHDDHTAGDVQFADRPDTTVLGADLAAATGFFGLPDWPGGTAQRSRTLRERNTAGNCQGVAVQGTQPRGPPLPPWRYAGVSVPAA